MTNAPPDLMAVRAYLLRATGLPADAVGIVGDPAHASTGGYHEGRVDLARVGRATSDYSVRESGRDAGGLSDSASALDIGDFTHNGKTLRQLSVWLVGRCQAGDARTRDIREVIYTPDGSTVRRWDRLGVRSTGDGSHLYHTHLSCFRDSEGRRNQPANILGLLTEFFEGKVTTAMALDGIDRAQVSNSERYLQALIGLTDTASGISNTVDTNLTRPNVLAAALKRVDAGVAQLLTAATAEAARDVAEKTVIDALAVAVKAGGGSVDTAAVLAGVADRVHAAVEPLEVANAELRAEITALRHALAEAERAKGAAAADVFDKPTP